MSVLGCPAGGAAPGRGHSRSSSVLRALSRDEEFSSDFPVKNPSESSLHRWRFVRTGGLWVRAALRELHHHHECVHRETERETPILSSSNARERSTCKVVGATQAEWPSPPAAGCWALHAR